MDPNDIFILSLNSIVILYSFGRFVQFLIYFCKNTSFKIFKNSTANNNNTSLELWKIISVCFFYLCLSISVTIMLSFSLNNIEYKKKQEEDKEKQEEEIEKLKLKLK